LKKLSFPLMVCLVLHVSLFGQVTNNVEPLKDKGFERKSNFNVEELKVRWKKAALENCPGVPCALLPNPPTNIIASPGNTSASITFVAPIITGASPIKLYTVTSSPGSITATGVSSPIIVTGLSNGTPYTFTVVATNEIGNSASSIVSTTVTPFFICSTSTITDIDNNTYNTVLIGNQCWTKQNLKVTKYNDGTPVTLDATQTSPGDGTSLTWKNRTAGAYTIYDNETSTGANAMTYGFLYNAYAAKGVDVSGSTTYKNLCPEGWHVPLIEEWKLLETFLGTFISSSFSGNALKSNESLWNINTGTDDFFFSARPAGTRNASGIFQDIREGAIFWSVKWFPTSAERLQLKGARGSVSIGGTDTKSLGASVRCLKD
jgi:uncharacterized protein (TIGR02145 family)